MNPKTILKKGDRVRVKTLEEALADRSELYRVPDDGDCAIRFLEDGTDPKGERWSFRMEFDTLKKIGGKCAVVEKCHRYSGEYHYHYCAHVDGVYGSFWLCPTCCSGFWEEEDLQDTSADEMFSALFGGAV